MIVVVVVVVFMRMCFAGGMRMIMRASTNAMMVALATMLKDEYSN